MSLLGQKEQPEFDPNYVSPSRLNSLVSCGVAFEMHYIERLKATRSGSAALFGNVIHRCLEHWALDRTQPILPLMRQAWLDVTAGDPIHGFILDYQALSVEAIKKEHEIREEWASRGKESKAPRMTKDWKDSDIAKRVAHLTSAWSRKLDESYWRFSEFDPLPGLYDESLPLSKRYEQRWKHLPPALVTEFKFEVPWRSFRVVGVIDAIERVEVDGEPVYLVTDYKTYKKEPTEMKDWRQKVTYDVAVRCLVQDGLLDLPDFDSIPLLVGLDYTRWTDTWTIPPRDYSKIEEPDYDRLEREFNNYRTMVTNSIFLPADKGRNADFCDYPERCCLRNCAQAGGKATRVEVDLLAAV